MMEMTPQIFLNTILEEKHATGSVSSVENRVNFAQQAEVGIWLNYPPNIGKSILNSHLNLLILHFVVFLLSEREI
jgi:hypothetical protein